MKKLRPIDAVYLRRKVVQMHNRLMKAPVNATSASALATLESVQRLIDRTVTLEFESEKPERTCDGCEWLCSRHQKCACCCRNRNMKDNFSQGGVNIG